jgi:hypothetical protein
VAQDSTIPAQPDEAPAEADTPEQTPSGTDANTPKSPAPADWEARYKAAQAEMTRKSQALAEAERRLAEAESYEESDDEDEDEPVQRTRRVSRTSQREAQLEAELQETQWVIARSIYPEDVIDAYAAAADLLEAAETPADYVGVFEAYHQRRSQGMDPEQAAASSRTPVQTSRIEAPRTEPDLTSLNNQAAEARKKGDLTGWVGALLRQQSD